MARRRSLATRIPAARPRADRLGDLVTSGMLLLGFAVGLAGLYRVLQGIGWWWQALAVIVIILASAAVVRSVTRHPAWGSLAGAAAGLFTIVAMFAAGDAVLWIIPTGDTIEALRNLEAAGLRSIADQDVPAVAEPGIVFLVCVGAAVLAVLGDLFAIGVRRPALAALPLGAIVLVPSFIRPAFTDALIFTLVAVVFVGLLLARAKQLGWRGTAGLAGTAILAALIAPVVLPPVIPGSGATTGSGLSTGLNPIVNLGEDLRRGDPRVALNYTTTSTAGQYLRLAVLDDFSGVSWRPTAVEPQPGNDIAAIPSPPGLTDAVPRTELVTDIQVGDVLSRWLPVPYAPQSVTGVEGTWTWEPDGLGIRSERSNARGQEYQVASILVQPTVEQLLAAGTVVESGFDRYLALPDELPDIVADTAAEVVGAATTNYERAVALQDFFTGGEFTYSEDAPVAERYDGSGAGVLEPFLERRAGYCVHFASAMAAMARTLGIPARLAVGFTPGDFQATENGEVITWTVTTHDLHAWPELYFAEIGWVRFEPTPGRGQVPTFAQAAADDPETPDVDESVPTPAATSTPAPTPSSAPVLPDEEPIDDGVSAAGGGTGGGTPWLGPLVGAAIVVVLLLPALWRIARRARRMRAVDDGSARAAWEELRDTATDLGWGSDPGLTPRQFAADVGAMLDDEGRRMLFRLRDELEFEFFAERPAEPVSDDLAAVLHGMRRSVGAGRTLLATLAPRSLVPPFLRPDQASGRNAITGLPATSSTVASTP